MTPEATANGDHSGAQPPAPAVGEPGPMLVMEHVTKSFGAVHALSDGSIELHAG